MKSFLLALVVIEEARTRTFIRTVLEGAGHRVIEPEGRAQAMALLANGFKPDLLLCDPNASKSNGAVSYREFLSILSPQSLCLLTKSSDQGLRTQAIQLGVGHFLNNPVTLGDVELLIENFAVSAGDSAADDPQDPKSAKITVRDELNRIESPSLPMPTPAGPFIEELGNGDFFLAASPKMLELHRQVKLLADIDANVLILGESGTGKEIVARLIHKHSKRSKEKLLKVNCAALPTELLESELFGHRHGAFTGAINDRAGKFEQANRGTLLLDEIGEIGVQMQAKLLHVLQDGQFARLGAQETTRVDVRVLAATNIEMESALLDKDFREDLYYRLSVFTIKVPPLRERREEIPYLIEEIIRRAPAEMTKGFGSCLPSRLMDAARRYDWRGNLRELRNFVTRTIVMRDTEAAAQELEAKASLPDSFAPPIEDVDPSKCVGIRSVVREVKARAEVQMIQNALEACGWNRRRAAQNLNMSYRGLLYKIQEHSLRPRNAGEPREVRQKAESVR